MTDDAAFSSTLKTTITQDQYSAAPKSLKWLNSMRALGVVLVLIYHFFPEFLPGGFIGVDIFFVVSGYLITTLLIKEFETTGGLKLPAFYWRRWRRLFPALIAMLCVSLPLLLLISKDFQVGIFQQSAAALSWTTNFYEILTGQSYEAQLLPHLFIHTWTLSIEMQYYLAWGFLILIIVLLKKRFLGLPLRLCILVLSVFIAAGSAHLMWAFAAGVDDPSVAYMSTLSHIFPLMIGSLFGCLGGFAPIMAKPNGLAARLQNGMSFFKPVSLILIVLGLATIIFISFTFSFNDQRTYHYGILVIALITGAILYLARYWQNLVPKTRREWIISDYIGIRSYSIYLFHWPLLIIIGEIVLSFNVSPNNAEWITAAIGIPLTFILSELSFRFVEQPFRAKRSVSAKDLPGGPLPFEKVKAARERNYAIGMSCVGIALVTVFVLIASPPRITSIESDLRGGALKISVSDIESAYENTFGEAVDEAVEENVDETVDKDTVASNIGDADE